MCMNYLLTYIHSTKTQFSQELKFNHSYSALYRFPKHKSNFYENSPLYSGLKLYNWLTNHCKEMGLTKFKEELRSNLLDKPFYSIKELLKSSIN
jgi:hypothetical protein